MTADRGVLSGRLSSSPPSPAGARRRRRSRPRLGTWAGLGAGAGLGITVGALTSLLQTVLPGTWNFLANAASPWLAAAFLGGLLVRRWPVAAGAGALACCGEVAGYYGLSSLRGFGVNPTWVLFWSLSAVLGGPVFALAGWLWRWSPRPRWGGAGAALLPVVFWAEGGVLHGVLLGQPTVAVLLCSVGAGLLVLVALVRPTSRADRSRWAAVTALGAWLLPAAAAGAVGEVLLLRVWS